MKTVRQFTGGHSERDWKVLDTLVTIAAELDRPVPQVALSWVAHRPGVVSTLIGARTLDQLEDNLVAWELELPAEHLARLEDISAPERIRPYLMFDEVVFERFLTPDMRIRSEPPWFRAA